MLLKPTGGRAGRTGLLSSDRPGCILLASHPHHVGWSLPSGLGGLGEARRRLGLGQRGTGKAEGDGFG